MSLKQFHRWLRERGVVRREGRFLLPCRGVAAAGAEENALSVVVSTRARDRHGDILEPAGMDATAFGMNPVVLWAHRHDALPVGRAASVRAGEHAVVAEVVFDTRPFAQEVLRLYREGFLAGWSVGFLPRKWQVINDENGRFDGYHVLEWELVELSAVPVPANPEALTRELAEGRIAPPALRKALGDLLHREATDPACVAPSPQGSADGRCGPGADADAVQPGEAAARALAVAEGESPEAPEVSAAALAGALTPRLLAGLRDWAARAAAREIRRRQGKVD